MRNDQPQRVLVAGAGYAGMLAAIRLAREAKGRCEVTLVSASDVFCERIRLHERAAGAAPESRSIPEMLRETGVSFKQGAINALDPDARAVTVNDEVIAFDRALYALGSRVDTSRVAGVKEHAFTLDPHAAEALRAKLASLREGASVLVLGGGLTGIEAATEFAERSPSLKVTLATRGALASLLSPRAREHLLAAFARLGVALVENVNVRELTQFAAVCDGRSLAFEACVWAGGFVATPLARDSGLSVNALGQVRVDAALRSVSHPWIYGIGDAASPIESVGSPLDMSCKTAMPMAAHAADNVARALRGEAETPFDFRDFGHCISLGRGDGIVQYKHRDGAPGVALTGAAAAWFKERICRYTVLSLRAERAGFRYRWGQTGDTSLSRKAVAA